VAAAHGKQDGRKQDALYVKIGRNGDLAGSPHAMAAKEEYERGRRFGQLLAGLAEFQRPTETDWERVEGVFHFLFAEKEAEQRTAADG